MHRHLNEQKVTKLATAAVLADEFVLTHFFSTTGCDRKSPAVFLMQIAPVKSRVEQARERCECFYCHKFGHVIADCLVLKKRNKVQTSKLIVFVKTVHGSQIDPVYQPFLLKGFVSFVVNLMIKWKSRCCMTLEQRSLSSVGMCCLLW